MRGWKRWVSVSAMIATVATAVSVGVSSSDKGVRVTAVLVATALIGGLVPIVSTGLDRSRAEIEKTRQAERHLLDLVARLTVGSDGGRLRRLDQVELATLGVRTPRESTLRERGQLPYAGRRELDPRLEQALTEHRFVLVHGPSAAGKSRSAAEATRRLYADRLVLIPDSDKVDTLAQLLDAPLDLSGVVLWLDDLDRHIAAGLTGAVAWKLLAISGLRIVATMRAAAYERYKERGGVRVAGRDVIDLAELVDFHDWNAADSLQARRRFASESDIVDALSSGLGLGQFLSAVPEMIDKLTRGAPPPSGIAVVHAAAAWYHVGMTRPAPLDLVRRLYPLYLPPDDARLLDQFEHGMNWACEPVAGARILTYRTDGTVTVHDSVFDYLATFVAAKVPNAAWHAIAEELKEQPDDLAAVGTLAYLHGNSMIAEHFLILAAHSGHDWAMFNLGVMLVESGRLAEAAGWYQAAANAGLPGIVNDSGALLRVSGWVDEGTRWFGGTIDTTVIDRMNDLASLLIECGQAEDAQGWYRAAANAGDARAMNNLGTLMQELGHTREAQDWYQSAADAGNTRAMINLAQLLISSGRLEEGENWLGKVSRDVVKYNL